LFLIGALVLVSIFNSYKESDQAVDKANQLSAALASAGLPVPPVEQIYRVLGDDGGAVCAPDGSQMQSILNGQLNNGAAGPGQRPVIADDKVVQGMRLIIQVYCPDKSAAFQEAVDNLKFDDVAA
jgi:hypothetical protein